MTTRIMLVEFDDGSYKEYTCKVYPGFEAAIEAAQNRLFEKLERGKNLTPPVTRNEMRRAYGDLRRFNGNHATGAGRKPVHNPGPKAVEYLAWDCEDAA